MDKIEKLEEKHKNKIEEIKEKQKNKIKNLEDDLNEIRFLYINQTKSSEGSTRHDTARNIEVTRPVFYGSNKDIHPIDFLNRMEENFAIKQTYIGEKIIIVGDCLSNAASNWFTTVRFQMENHDDFKKAFMDESREIQVQIWSQCLSIKQIPANENCREHFATRATKLRHLQAPRLSEEEIVKNIAKHYPGYIRVILVSLPERTILAAMQILGEEGASPRLSENNSPTNQTTEEIIDHKTTTITRTNTEIIGADIIIGTIDHRKMLFQTIAIIIGITDHHQPITITIKTTMTKEIHNKSIKSPWNEVMTKYRQLMTTTLRL